MKTRIVAAAIAAIGLSAAPAFASAPKEVIAVPFCTAPGEFNTYEEVYNNDGDWRWAKDWAVQLSTGCWRGVSTTPTYNNGAPISAGNVNTLLSNKDYAGPVNYCVIGFNCDRAAIQQFDLSDPVQIIQLPKSRLK